MPRPRAFANADEMWEAVDPMLVVVASPPNTHVRFLNKALTSRTHALCEKPIGWEDGPSKELDTLVHAFHDAELHLAVHAQWPFTLPTYRALYPDVTLDRAKSFAMILCPRAPGLGGLVDSLSHPLSVLAAVCPDPEAFVDVPLTQIPEDARAPGTELAARDPEGRVQRMRVHKVEGETATLDLNHPLAGKQLHFSVKILEVGAGE